MAMVTASTSLHLGCLFTSLHSPEPPNFPPFSKNHGNPFLKLGSAIETTRKRPLLSPLLVKNDKFCEVIDNKANEEEEEEMEETSETFLYSFSPLPLLFVAALPGGTFLLILCKSLKFLGSLKIVVICVLKACKLFSYIICIMFSSLLCEIG